jgi:endonuclease/exonuclease/phosphatase family metal-dependent hydrolase
MSFNIRYGTANDGENRWDTRREFLVQTIQDFDPDLLGTQETLADQRDYLAKHLVGYSVVAAGRDDGLDKGEMAALYYRTARFKLLDSGHVWLSTTPETPGSRGWDAALPRVATWVKLEERGTKAKPIYYINTHFDHRGSKARLESAKLIRKLLAEQAKDCRCIATGDFNAGEGSEPYRALFEQANGAEAPVRDSLRALHPKAGQDEGTFTGFKATNTKGERIDWIGVSGDFTVRVAGIDRTNREGRTPSDHAPVFAVLRPQDESATVRVLSYNIHHGEGTDGKLDLRRIASVIHRADPDVVMLQEVDNGCNRSGGVDQARELARLTGYTAHFGKAMAYDGGEYGQALLCRTRLEDVSILPLPGEAKTEPRIILSGAMSLGVNQITVASVHLDHQQSTSRVKQVNAILKHFASSESIMILAGDFNAEPGSDELNTMDQHWQRASASEDVPTFPAAKPTRAIDHVYYHQAQRFTVKSVVAWEEAIASDHRPLLVVLAPIIE